MMKMPSEITISVSTLGSKNNRRPIGKAGVKRRPPCKSAMILRSSTKHSVPATEMDTPGTSSSVHGNMLTDNATPLVIHETKFPKENGDLVKNGSEKKDCDQSSKAPSRVQGENNVTPKMDIENVTSNNENLFTGILNDNDSLAMFEEHVLNSCYVVKPRYLRTTGTTSFFILSPNIYKTFTKLLVQNMFADLNERMSRKMESSLVESFFAIFDIDRLVNAKTESNEDDAESVLIREELRGAANNISEAEINEAKKSASYQAASSEFRAALGDILKTEALSRRVKALLPPAPPYRITGNKAILPLRYRLWPTNPRDERLKTSLVNLLRKEVTESAALNHAAQKMMESTTTSTERLEKWVQELRESLVRESQKPRQEEPAVRTKAGLIADVFHKMKGAFGEWIKKRRPNHTENRLPSSTI